MDNFTNIDFKKNEIRKGVIEPLHTEPINPVVGQIYFDTTLKVLRIWDGKEWVSNIDLPIATTEEIGVVKIGERLIIEPDGTLSAVLQSDNNFSDSYKDMVLNIPSTIRAHNMDATSHPYLVNLISQESYNRQSDNLVLQNAIDSEISRATSAEAYLQLNKEDIKNKIQTITPSSSTASYPSGRAVYNALLDKVDANPDILASSEFKVVKYDEKGLVTEGRKIIDDDISGGIDASKIGDGTISNIEFKALDNISGNIQLQLDQYDSSKANKIDGTIDLDDVNADLLERIREINDTIGYKGFDETICEKIRDLSYIPTVMQANSDSYTITHINITSKGSGYQRNETFELGNVEYVSVRITDVDDNGGILSISWDTTDTEVDIAGSGFQPVNYQGNGVGAEFSTITRYSVGNDVVNGHLLHVPDDDPLVQFTRMKGYVDATLTDRNNIEIVGYASSVDPSSLIDGLPIGVLWYETTIDKKLDTTFPWKVRRWDGINWSANTQDYRPTFNDIWINKNVTDPIEHTAYYWVDDWVAYGFSIDTGLFVQTNSNQTINGIKEFTSTIKGNIDTSNKLKNPRAITLEGGVSGTAMFDGSSNITINTTVNGGAITGNTIVDGSITSQKIANTKLTNVKIDSNKNTYTTDMSKSYQGWLDSYASKLNWLIENKNKTYIQSSEPSGAINGDLWIQLMS